MGNEAIRLQITRMTEGTLQARYPLLILFSTKKAHDGVGLVCGSGVQLGFKDWG